MMWVRPSYRTYAYNLSKSLIITFLKITTIEIFFHHLDVGEQYYSPLADYVKIENNESRTHPGLLPRRIHNHH